MDEEVEEVFRRTGMLPLPVKQHFIDKGLTSVEKVKDIPVADLQSLSEYFNHCPGIENVAIRRALFVLLEEIRNLAAEAERQRRSRRRTEPIPPGAQSTYHTTNRNTMHVSASQVLEDSSSTPAPRSRFHTANNSLLIQAYKSNKDVNIEKSSTNDPTPQITEKGSRASRMRDQSAVINQDGSLYALPKVEVVKDEGFRKLRVGKSRIGPIGDKVMLIVGGTGSGKSTFVNALANYLYEVDFNDPFRFQLITAKDQEKEAGTTDAGKSMTKIISAYELNETCLRYRLTIVDTPGFCDTEGIERDKKTEDYIRKWFERKDEHGLKTIDAICIVIKGTENRMTAEVKHILRTVQSLFDRNFTPNIITVFTFCDSSKPPAIDALSDDSLLLGDTQLLFNSIGMLNINEADKVIINTYHTRCRANFTKLFDKLEKLEPHSVVYTLEVLQSRKALEEEAIALNGQIIDLLPNMEEISMAVQLLLSNSSPNQSIPFMHDGKVDQTSLEEIYRRYGIIDREGDSNGEKLLERLGLQLLQLEKKLGDAVVSVRTKLNRLNEIAMRPEQVTDSEYIQYLIKTLSTSSTSVAHYDQRINILHTHLKIVKLLEAVHKGVCSSDVTESAAIDFLGYMYPELYKQLRLLRRILPYQSDENRKIKAANVALETVRMQREVKENVKMRSVSEKNTSSDLDRMSLDSSVTSESDIDAELEERNRMIDRMSSSFTYGSDPPSPVSTPNVPRWKRLFRLRL